MKMTEIKRKKRNRPSQKIVNIVATISLNNNITTLLNFVSTIHSVH